MKAEIKCRYCKSKNYKKQGFRKTEKRGRIQKYKCLDCGRYFTNDDGFYRMRNKPKIITMSIDMYISNLSSRKMRNQLRRHMNLKISHVTVLAWVRKYILKVQKFIDKLKPKLSGNIYADETEVKCQNRNDIFWCSVDWNTRYINASLYSPNQQNIRDAEKFLKKVKESKEVYTINTDASGVYPKAIKKVFFNQKDKRVAVFHNIINYHKDKKYNVRIESLFSKIKDRVQDFRCFKALWSAPILMAGIVIQHNFIEAHTTTRELPCELAGLKLRTGLDRWLGLIRLSSI
jgi:transposase-like protein